MATIRPFQGTRFTASTLDDLVAPPYDVISDSERAALAAKSPNNMVFLTLPEQNEDDRSKFVKYTRSASRLQNWVDTGVMRPESKDAFYRYIQTFESFGKTFTRTALIALIKVEPYENGVVLPHEQTFPKHKEDRLRVLEATRTHLECIYGLFEDPNQQIFNQITEAPANRVADVTTEDGVRHIVEVIDDETACQGLQQQMADRKVWIADGHHRYETAMAFRSALGPKDGVVAEDFMMMALSSMEDPGLVLLPTHRILKQAPDDLIDRLHQDFWFLEECINESLVSKIEEMEKEGARGFGVAMPGGVGFTIRIDNLQRVTDLIPGSGSQDLKSLDVSILHEVIFDQCLGLTGHDFFGYTRDPQEALDAVEGGAPASFLMNPPTVHDMKRVALSGDKMPQKSTYYYPKILSGLVLWRLEDF